MDELQNTRRNSFNAFCFFFCLIVIVDRNPVDYSYGMYLLHFLLINIFTYFDFFEKAPIFVILIIIASVFAMAFVVEKYIINRLYRICFDRRKVK